MKLIMKSFYDFVSHIIAADPDSRTERRHEVLRSRTVILAKRFNAMLCDSAPCSSPAGMQIGQRAALDINQKNREAIGGLNAQ